MKTLTFSAARYFASKYSADAKSKAAHLEDLISSLPPRKTSIDEGTSEFEWIKDGLLRDTERSALMAASSYSRALENLRPASAFWAATGLYYSCFFAARAVLGMLGCWCGGAKNWLDVSDSTPGALKLTHHRTHYDKTTSGSHRIFWRAYYAAVPSIANWVSPAASIAMQPVNAKEMWLIDSRNTVNYSAIAAFALTDNYEASYDATKLPACLPPPILPLLSVSKAFFLLMSELLQHAQLATDVIGARASRKIWLADLVTAEQDASLRTFCSNSGVSLPI